MYERRFFNSRVSFRDGAQSLTEFSATDPPTIVGYAARFATLSSDLGGFKEKIFPGAFTGSLRSPTSDVKMLRDHDPSKILGRQKNKTLTLAEDYRGLQFSCLLPDTSEGRDIYSLVKRGDVGDCSFAFEALEQSWSEETDPDTNERINVRTLMSVRLLDTSVVTNPAYPGTSVEVSGMSPIVMGRSYEAMFPQGTPVEVRSRVGDVRANLGRAQERRRNLVHQLFSL